MKGVQIPFLWVWVLEIFFNDWRGAGAEARRDHAGFDDELDEGGWGDELLAGDFEECFLDFEER